MRCIFSAARRVAMGFFAHRVPKGLTVTFRFLSKQVNKTRCHRSFRAHQGIPPRRVPHAGPGQPGGLAAGKISELTDIVPSSLSFHPKGLSHADLVDSQQPARFVTPP